MAKRAAILHGTNGNPEENWQPWLKAELENRGYEVFMPQLPGADRPNWSVYEDYLRTCGWDFTDCILVGHSSGSTAMLRLLESEWFPRVKASVFVGLFVGVDELERTSPSWYEPGMFDALFRGEEFRTNVIKSKAGKAYIIHGDDDPYCDVNDAKRFAKMLDATLEIVPGGKHLSIGSGGFHELPQILEVLGRDGAL